MPVIHGVVHGIVRAAQARNKTMASTEGWRMPQTSLQVLGDGLHPQAGLGVAAGSMCMDRQQQSPPAPAGSPLRSAAKQAVSGSGTTVLSFGDWKGSPATQLQAGVGSCSGMQQEPPLPARMAPSAHPPPPPAQAAPPQARTSPLASGSPSRRLAGAQAASPRVRAGACFGGGGAAHCCRSVLTAAQAQHTAGKPTGRAGQAGCCCAA